jgi:superfamily II DNA helicase RecQ
MLSATMPPAEESVVLQRVGGGAPSALFSSRRSMWRDNVAVGIVLVEDLSEAVERTVAMLLLARLSGRRAIAYCARRVDTETVQQKLVSQLVR